MKLSYLLLLSTLLCLRPQIAAAQKQESAGEKPPATKIDPQTKTTPALASAPVYKPPARGVPKGRVGGGTRGLPSDSFAVAVFAPDHSGLTIHEQPALYWYLSKTTSEPIEFTFIEDWAVKPIVETQITSAQRPGVQVIRLADYGVRLKAGVVYRWFVAIIPDRENRSKDILAGGMIELVEATATLANQIKQARPEQSGHAYAEAGLWYDAIAAFSQRIDAAPGDPRPRQDRATLLDQVGLSEIADHDRGLTR